jgi:hypothetical protein
MAEHIIAPRVMPREIDEIRHEIAAGKQGFK